MKLSNTLMMNAKLMPTTKKAFTLAEVLITLSILGVVAALTIPSLVNRQSDLAAQVKLKKAISAYEDVIGTYMAENERADARAMSGTLAANGTSSDCNNISNYFKVVKTGADNCNFVTADGVAWRIDPATGNAVVTDNEKHGAARYQVVMWNANNRVNTTGSSDNVSNIFQSVAGNAANALAVTPYTGSDNVASSLVDTTRFIVTAPDFMQSVYYCKTNGTPATTGDACPNGRRPQDN